MSKVLCALVVTAVLAALPASAQATRTFVSATGSDANPCTFAAPCRTLQHAHNVTAANGVIDVLDPGGYGALSISKSITVQGHGWTTMAASPDTLSAVSIIAGHFDDITLRGLVLDGFGQSGNAGISLAEARTLDVEDCVIANFPGGGILFTPVFPNVPARLFVSNTRVTGNGGVGIQVSGAPSGGTTFFVVGVFDKVQVAGTSNGSGVRLDRAHVIVRDSIISFNNPTGIDEPTVGGQITLLRSQVVGNGQMDAVATVTAGQPANGVFSYGNNLINGVGTTITTTLSLE